MGERRDYAYGQSRYLRADEMAGRTLRVRVESVEDIEFEQGVKPVIGPFQFEGKDKYLPVGATNFDILADAISGRTDDWVGHTILLKGEKIRFKGRLVDSIRVSVPKQTKPTKAQPPQADDAPDFDDGIPDFA
jgi:hypothetical protein